MQSRAWLQLELASLGFRIVPSQANFLFVRHASRDARELQRLLREHNVLVRHFQQPRIAQFLRITIGTPEEC
jgi:histidinol-phosphate aminotransferase